MRTLTRFCCALAVVLSALLTSSLTPNASASNFTVNSIADTPDANTADGLCADANGACTLRAAIQQANADPSGDVIGFSVTGTIDLSAALPDISKSIDINGPGAFQLIVRRNNPAPFRIFKIIAGVFVHISGLTVHNGLAPLPVNGGPPEEGEGGGIYNAGALTLTGVTVNFNFASSSGAGITPVAPGGGGGISNSGALTMIDCEVSRNFAGSGNGGLNGADGGGILNTGALTMTGCTVKDNTAGSGGHGSVTGGEGGRGGGIFNAVTIAPVTTTLTNCVVSGNMSGEGGTAQSDASGGTNGNGGNGGGIYSLSSLAVVNTVIAGNVTGRGENALAGSHRTAGKGGSGGGVFNGTTTPGRGIKLTNCVVRDNATGHGGYGGGVVQSLGDGGNGGGLANVGDEGQIEMTDCTVVFNRAGLAGDAGGHDGVGGGVYGGVISRSSVVALNSVRFPSNLSDVAGGNFGSGGYNYVGFFGVGCCFLSTDRGGGGEATPTLIRLDPNTLIPFPDSPLIDAGLAQTFDTSPVTTDIRGAARPFDFPDVAPQPGGDNSDIGALERQATDPTPTPTPTTTTVQFASSTAHVPEGCLQADITVTRSGPKDGTTVATYVVTDFSRSSASQRGDTSANQRGDFTYTKGKVTFAPGEDTKTIPVLVNEDAYSEGSLEFFEVFIVEVEGGVPGAPNPVLVFIDDNDATDGATNPIDDNATFVCQHYHDFLSRQADPAGQAFWTARLEECGTDAACLDRKRVDVSAAFFLSIEFQNSGYYVIRVNKVVIFDHPGVPDYFRFLEETQDVARGVIVGQPGFEAVLEANKQRYAERWVQGANFQTAHGGQTAAQYVDSLFANVGVTPTTQERDAAISAFGAGGTAGQAAALRSIVESGSVFNKLYNSAFVQMQYFGYLRRNPNDRPDNFNFTGYQFWLDKLNAATLPGEDARDETVAIRRIRRAEMIPAFLRSTEYRGRFGGDPSRGNP